MNKLNEELTMQPDNTSHRNLSSANAGSCSGQRNKRPRLGQILVGAGLVETDTLHSCLRVAKRTHQKLGAVLVDKKVISGQDLESALLAQKFIADGTVPEASSAKILQAASRQGIDVTTAIKLQSASGLDHACHIPELAELLLGSGLIKAPALAQIQSTALTSGMSLGKALLITNALSTENLDAILIMIVLIRSGSLSMQDAIKGIRDLRYNRIDVTRDSLRFPNRSKGYAPLGELLVESNCVNDFECVFAIESALASNRQLGQMLIHTGLVSESIINNALLLQKFTAAGVIGDELAAVALRRIEADGLSLVEVARELKLFKDSRHATAAIELLMEGGYVDAHLVQQAIGSQAAFEMDPAKALLASASVSAALMGCAKTCIEHLESGDITLTQAFELLQEAHHNQFAVAHCVVTKAVSQAKATAQLQQQAIEASKPVKKLRNEVLNWSAYPEFKLLVVFAVIISGGIFAVLRYVPEQFQWQCLLAALVVTAAVLFQTGRSWTRRSEDKVLSHSLRMESAQQTMQKLQKRSR